MNSTFGYFLLIGGLLGAIRCALAKRFYRSDFMNSLDGVVSDEDRKTEVRVSKVQRWLLVTGCLLLAAVGWLLIQPEHKHSVVAMRSAYQHSEPD